MKKRAIGRLILGPLLAFGLLLVACNSPPGETAAPSQIEPALDVLNKAAEVLARVQRDLAEHLSLPADEVRVVEVRAVEWSDASLGCPAPAQTYDQVLTAGYEIVMEADDATYSYHAGGESIVRCSAEGPSVMLVLGPDAPDSGEAETIVSDLLEQALQNLGSRLGLPPNTIAVEAVEAVEWDDSSLGCPEPGVVYLTVITPGYRILLAANDQVYEYHTDMREAYYCDKQDAGGPDPGSVEAQVRADLARRLGIDRDGIAVVAIESVDWPDSSLGCPQPGVLYEQVVTPGHRVVLHALDREFIYHTGPDSFVLCDEPSSTGPVFRERPTELPRLDPQVARLVDQAKKDLSQWLGVDLADIKLESVEPVQWRNSSLGCPKPGMAYLTVITPGYLIHLEADGEIYEYHTDRTRAVYCEDPQPPLTEQ